MLLSALLAHTIATGLILNFPYLSVTGKSGKSVFLLLTKNLQLQQSMINPVGDV